MLPLWRQHCAMLHAKTMLLAVVLAWVAVVLFGCNCKKGGVQDCTDEYENRLQKIGEQYKFNTGEDATRAKQYRLCMEVTSYATCIKNAGCCEEESDGLTMREKLEELERTRWGTCKRKKTNKAEMVDHYCYGNDCDEIAVNVCPTDADVLVDPKATTSTTTTKEQQFAPAR
eukprot:TRINITY_DN62129_c0_g1_i1.p1 TRINITY_DN62129_c0_g1~~TRINITY_DN62129_c0_g1_i1.p1  ORF type:complete len:187 (+),score=32.29 TRINITY_DN62129_c0_g1_i1:46-561(+)